MFDCYKEWILQEVEVGSSDNNASLFPCQVYKKKPCVLSPILEVVRSVCRLASIVWE